MSKMDSYQTVECSFHLKQVGNVELRERSDRSIKRIKTGVNLRPYPTKYGFFHSNSYFSNDCSLPYPFYKFCYNNLSLFLLYPLNE